MLGENELRMSMARVRESLTEWERKAFDAGSFAFEFSCFALGLCNLSSTRGTASHTIWLIEGRSAACSQHPIMRMRASCGNPLSCRVKGWKHGFHFLS